MKKDGFLQNQLSIFDFVKFIYLTILFMFLSQLKAQDKIYLLDGTKRTVKIREVGIDVLIYSEISESGAPFANSREELPKKSVLLVEYKNGEIEIFNRPEKNSVSTSQGLVAGPIKKTENTVTSSNLIYINTLALCNADISGFFEHLNQNKKIGIGLMAAYNFNPYATFTNLFVAVLYNGKKKYDAGAFINFYPKAFKRKTTFTYGLMIKYTAISFSNVVEEKNGTSTNIIYVPSTGGQLATILTIGTHSYLAKNFFLKTQIGLGGFTLRGDYKTQYNYVINEANQGTDYTYSFLPKVYVGFNLGFHL